MAHAERATDGEGQRGPRAGERLTAALRSVPRALREDLWTVARDPLPRFRLLGWLPHVHVVLFAVGMLLLNLDQRPSTVEPSAAVWLIVVVQSATVVLALVRPVPAWWLSTIGFFVTVAAQPHGASWPSNAAAVALHTMILLLLSLRVRLRVAVEALALTIASGLASAAVTVQAQHQNVMSCAVFFTTAVIVGASLRTGRVARRRLVEQEVLTAEERARRTLLEERGRIARELHDVVAHHMSVISIQAQVAPHLVRDPSEELKENLAGIRQNAVEALTELRRVLGVLRSEEASAEGERHTPQPTLDRLDELIGNVRGAGLTVTAETTGAPRALSPGLELSAFRIVQEALSNAMRHAPGSQVKVALAYHPAGLTVGVSNTAPDRPGPPSTGAGHGLLGMRERAALLGGDLATGPTPDGGYEVTAFLPAPAPAVAGRSTDPV
ncbi:sensor histidine kinase [Streptomyces sp. LX-29]|uniref:sensor histidine kinase n=1 Tax=Streptomyces sp. LX-29 TaxID=2900152 RepID=UPI00240E2588|nr:sensor histidine kinase [Streptomyces sp. LX-29]WFB06027.1 sensor histidine kinase [Streptomyces sp. LX-29]